jgi:flagellar biosynthesis protein FlhF
MRIKRFTAPDMRTALRMVREEQGPDAVILSNRATADGIEVVAATDYDEALVSQALRMAVPEMAPAPPAVVVTLGSKTASAAIPVVTAAAAPAPKTIDTEPLAKPEHATASIAHHAAAAAPSSRESSSAPRESLISRARAIFRIADTPANDQEPTLAELTAASGAEAEPAPAAPKIREAGLRFEEMIAVFNPPASASDVDAVAGDSQSASPIVTSEAPELDTTTAIQTDAPRDADESDADYLISLTTGGAPAVAARVEAASRENVVPAPRPFHAIANEAAETDPAIVAMRRELATMRQLMERQMEQLSLERLRGSPARAAAFETLLGLGCDTAIAQAVAGNLDPRIAPAGIQQPMLEELMRTLTIARSEPIEDGGVIALVGPTGAGKTTTAAKLAARFAARHRARDVALVSIDRERTGAREQLHALGRRLGVTVCDADNSDALGRALEQLADYPLVLVDTAGYGVRDRALLRQILWLRSSSRLRSLLVLPANAHPHDLTEIARRYRPAAPEGVVLTKLDESGRLGAALSVLAQQQLPLAYTCSGQIVPEDLEAASAESLADLLGRQANERRGAEKLALEPELKKAPGAAVNPLAIEESHAFA